MPRKEARDLEFGITEDSTRADIISSNVDIKTEVINVKDEVVGVQDVVNESNMELRRIRRANELILDDEVEEPIEE